MTETEDRRPVVIVVDDDEAVRDSLRFLLETAGFEVDTFASACQFLSVAYSRPMCLLVDQHMPLMTGLDLLRRLRDSGRAMSAALMTGSPSPDLIRLARELGADDVLEKPLPDAALFGFLTRFRV